MMADKICPIVLTTASFVNKETGSQDWRWDTVWSMKEKCPAVGEVDPGDRREEEERKNECVEQ